MLDGVQSAHLFPQEFLDELKTLIPMPSLVGRRVRLLRIGQEHKGLCPFHADKNPSLHVYGDHYHCFGCGAHGDAIDWVTSTAGIEFQAAVSQLAGEAGLPLPDHIRIPPCPNGRTPGASPSRPIDDWRPIVPAPSGEPDPAPNLLRCDTLHTYLGADGDLQFYVRRTEARDGQGKQFSPLTYGILNGKAGWHARAPAALRPLYGLDRLAAVPTAPVLVCEGEKSADAAQRLFPSRVCVSWMGGANAVDKTDWAVLAGRQVAIWPDNDPAGHKAAADLLKFLPAAQQVRVDGLCEGYDAANLESESPDVAHAWLDARLPEPDRAEPSPNSKDDLVGGLPLDVWDAGEDDYVVPPRGWLLGTTFCRRFMSSVIADGAVGKTAVRLAQLFSLAIGRSLTGEYVHRRCRVLFVSLEDDKDELRRRVLAILQHYNIDPAHLKGWLYLAAPKGLKLMVMANGAPQVGALDGYLRETIARLKLDVVSLDPFVKTHGIAENDNTVMDMVCDILASIAVDLDCAIDAPHHTNKGPAVAGDANRGRGASSTKDAARLVYTLTPMTPEEGQMFDLSEIDRRSLVRMDSGKVNIAPPSSEAKWFRIVGQVIGNATPDYPHGDVVQTVEPWEPPDTWAGLDHALLNRILDQLDAGLDDGQRYSGANAATGRAAWRVVQQYAPEKSEQICRQVIAAWLKSGTLLNEKYEDPVQRRNLLGVRVNAAKRPS